MKVWVVLGYDEPPRAICASFQAAVRFQQGESDYEPPGAYPPGALHADADRRLTFPGYPFILGPYDVRE